MSPERWSNVSRTYLNAGRKEGKADGLKRKKKKRKKKKCFDYSAAEQLDEDAVKQELEIMANDNMSHGDKFGSELDAELCQDRYDDSDCDEAFHDPIQVQILLADIRRKSGRQAVK
jgi:hypothetical protein